GGTVALSLSLSSSAPVPPSALQWTLTYATSDVLSISAAAGPVLTAAGKTITCQAGSGTLSCLASGMNGSTIANGVAAVVTVTLTPTSSSSVSIPMTSA